MGVDPLDSFLLRSEFPEVMNGAIRPNDPHTPNAAFLYWR